MALELLCFLHLFTEYSLYNANSLVACIFYAQRKDIIASRFFFNVFLTSEVLMYPPSSVATYAHLLGHSLDT
jgi:hypothetical protein